MKDYKFFCFNGCVKFFKVDFDRFEDHFANYYDPEANLLDFGEAEYAPRPTRRLEVPSNLHEMLNLAGILSKGFPFLRVDFYSISGKTYFGELTFFPASGFGRWTDRKWDLRLGEYITLPPMKEEYRNEYYNWSRFCSH